MTECYDVTCHNEASGSKGFRGVFCKRCKISAVHFTLPCLVCKGTFVKSQLSRRLSLYCSNRCRDRAGYNRRMIKQLNEGIVKPRTSYNNVLSILLVRRCNAKMLCEHTGYTMKALPAIIYRLRHKEGWNIKNYHGYYELEEDL